MGKKLDNMPEDVIPMDAESIIMRQIILLEKRQRVLLNETNILRDYDSEIQEYNRRIINMVDALEKLKEEEK